MKRIEFGGASRALPSFPSRSAARKTLLPNRRRLVAGKLSHYSALYEVQQEQPLALPLDAAHQHLHHMVHGASNAFGPLYLATFCALSVTLGALLYNLTNVLNEYFSLQQQLSNKPQDKPLLYGVDVSSSQMFRSKRVRAAAAFAAAAHAGQFRKTGEPYVTHCIETALIVEANLPHWRQDSRHETAVIAALLHDVLDDTPTTPEALSAAFGPAVCAMVVKVSKLSAVNQMLRRDKRKGVVRRDDSFWQGQWRRLKRMMFEAVVEEPLVILIKLADRLHNMRTVYALHPAKQQAVAEETLAVWCSMAASLGWHRLKSEMEDLCFAVVDTSTYCTLRQQLDKLWSSPPPPRSRRRVKSSRRQQQLQQFAEQQQLLAAERASRWGQGLLHGLQQGFKLMGPKTPAAAAAAQAQTSSGSSSTDQDLPEQQLSSSSSNNSSVDGSVPQPVKFAVGEQQQQRMPGLNLLLRSFWKAGPAAARHGLLPAPAPTGSDQDQDQDHSISFEEPRRPCGGDWGVTDAAMSLTSLLNHTASSSTSSSSSSATSSHGGARAAASATAARPQQQQQHVATTTVIAAAATSSSSSSSPKVTQLSPQQQQLRQILSTVVQFDAVSLTGANKGLTWSAQQGLRVLDEAASRLYNELAVGSFSGGLKVEIQGRLKSLRSVHNKMERKSCSVEEVYDARALRVVVDDGGGARLADAVQCCYRLVSAVHKLWRPIHGEFDDYIANPKPSGYQALHTAVWGPEGAALEVQIKTAGMHEHAEYGGAAHWAYKEVLWGSAPAAAAAVDSVERNVAAAAAAASAASSSGPAVAQQQGQQQQQSLAEGVAAAAAAAAAAKKSAKLQSLPTVLFTFDDDGHLVSSSNSSRSTSSSTSSNPGAALSSFASFQDAVAERTAVSVAAVAATVATAATASTGGGNRQKVLSAVTATAAPVAASLTQMVAAAGVKLAPRPIAPAATRPEPPQQQQQLGVLTAAAAASSGNPRLQQQQQQQRASAAVATLERPTQPAEQAQLRPAPPVYIGQPVLRVADRLRYGVVLAPHQNSRTGNRGSRHSSSSSTPSLLHLDRAAAAAELTAAAVSCSSSSSSRSSLVCVIMSGGTNPDHPWRMPDYGFYQQLLNYATSHGWNRPGQGDWHVRLEEYAWCRDGRWHRLDHMGYVHPHTTLTLLEGYEQDAEDLATAAAIATTAAAANIDSAGMSAVSSSKGAGAGSSTGSSASNRGAAVLPVPAPAAAPDAAMLRHSWATGGGSSSSGWRQRQQEQDGGKAAGNPAAARESGNASSSALQQQQPRSLADAQAAPGPSSGSTSSTAADAAATGGGSSPSMYGGSAAAGPDWAATAAKAAQLRSVIEWGLEAYGVNAAGSEPSSEVSVVIWPGGMIEDYPRGTTAGQILQQKGVLAILDPTTTSSSDSDSSSSSSDEEPTTTTATKGGSNSSSNKDGGRELSPGQRQQQQQQQLVNVNNRLVSEDTVLCDGDLVILAREKIKI